MYQIARFYQSATLRTQSLLTLALQKCRALLDGRLSEYGNRKWQHCRGCLDVADPLLHDPARAFILTTSADLQPESPVGV